MAKTVLSENFELALKDKYNKADCTVSIVVECRSLPTTALLGIVLEEVTKLVQERVAESYNEVPPRPIGKPPVSAESAPVPEPVVANSGNADVAKKPWSLQ